MWRLAHHPALDPDRPALIGQLYGRRLASEVKLALMNAYPDDHPVTLVRAAGTEQGATTAMPLYELDRRQGADHLTTLYVPAAAPHRRLGLFSGHRRPAACAGRLPWDQEQTHQTLRADLLEEAYEVLAALDAERCR